MTACPWAITDLLPHDPPMVLLDRVDTWDATGLTAAVTVTPATRFVDPNQGVPAHVGLEWMAQACAAFAGVTARSDGQPIRLGFLLGTRDFAAGRSWFQLGETLVVSVRQVLHEGGMAVFDCRIDAGETKCASARLTVFQPDDAALPEALS